MNIAYAEEVLFDIHDSHNKSLVEKVTQVSNKFIIVRLPKNWVNQVILQQISDTIYKSSPELFPIFVEDVTVLLRKSSTLILYRKSYTR